MTNNIKLIYNHIQKDLKTQGWNDEAIAEAIAEAQRERQATGADDETICIKEMSYLNQESLLKIILHMNKEKNKINIFVRLKNKIVDLTRGYCRLNWDAKIGILFLTPPILGVIMFILNLFEADLGFGGFPRSWNCIPPNYQLESEGYATPAIPLYLGLMAIAGAYLIKGNLKNKD